MDLEAHHSFLVLLVKGVLDGDPAARRIFEQADFKAAVDHWTDHYRKGIDAHLREPGKAPEKEEVTDEIDPDDFMHWIVAGEEAARNALADLRMWLKGAESVVICDPYVMQPKKAALFESDEHYIQHVKKLLPKSAMYVDFFGMSFTQKIKKKLLREVKHGRRRVRFYDTNVIHDRYIVRDRRDGRVIGTSLGGFGNKIFTVLDLPADDTNILVAHLDKIRRQQAGS